MVAFGQSACTLASRQIASRRSGRPPFLPLFLFSVSMSCPAAQSASSSPSSRARKNTFIRPICAAAELSSRMCDGGGACMRAAPLLLPSFPSSQPARSHRQPPVSWPSRVLGFVETEFKFPALQETRFSGRPMMCVKR